MVPIKRVTLAVLIVVAMLLAACGNDGASSGSTSGQADDEPGGTITVSAAASLTEAFGDIGADFEAAHPGTTVTFNFDSSGALAEQIRKGAPADVFASANEEKMTGLEGEQKLDGAADTFARNRLAIVTKPGNPEGIEELADLASAGVVSLCSEDAPCGSFATEVLDRADVEIPADAVTRGQNVKATLTALTEGDAVAAMVYVTDATTVGDQVTTVDTPDADNAIASYPIAVVADAPNPDLARSFTDYVASKEGQDVLGTHGFLSPA